MVPWVWGDSSFDAGGRPMAFTWGTSKLWWLDDMSMYIYYSPTHWRAP